MRHSKNRFCTESGIIAMVTALLLPILIGMLGIIIDLGFAYQYKRYMQTAADAGALGAAHSLLADETESTIETDALFDAAMNGFDGSHGETRSVNIPPTGGDFVGDNNFIEVVISRDLPTYFMPVLGIDQMTVRTVTEINLPSSGFCCLFRWHEAQRGIGSQHRREVYGSFARVG